MIYAIIAAGEGSRLRKEGILTPKPLIRVNGLPLIERHILRAIKYGFSEICIIINQRYPELSNWFADKSFGIPLRLVEKNTPSSLHSFFELGILLKGKDFLLTTVDPVFPDPAFQSFLAAIGIHTDAQGIMAVTTYVDDESPLWVNVSDNGQITGYSNAKGNARYASAGFYYFKPAVLPLLDEAIKTGRSRMRAFQQFLVDKNVTLMAVDVGKVVDLDHKGDIAKAEHILRETN